MFRSTMVITSPTLTFSTAAEFSTEISNYFDNDPYIAYRQQYIDDDKLLTNTRTLTDSQTLSIVKEWDTEESYNAYYPSEFIDITTLTTDGWIINVSTETI